jgi:hypothetical protein
MSTNEESERQGLHLVLYRIAENNPLTEWDVTSHQDKGIPIRHRTAKALRLWSGISVYRSPSAAESHALESPRLGSFVAELRIPLDGSVRFELDNGPSGHCTIWGDPKLLLKFVVRIWRVERVH